MFGINRIPVDVRDRDITGLAIELVPSQVVTGILTIDATPRECHRESRYWCGGQSFSNLSGHLGSRGHAESG
jgi:hypothetical protein